MSSGVFTLSDVSLSNNSDIVSVNNSDSLFGLSTGSQLFVAGKRPVTIDSHNTTTRELTLSDKWNQGTLQNVSATIVPLTAVSKLFEALENNRLAYEALTEAIKTPGGELSPIVEQALQYLDTQVAASPAATRIPSLSHVLSDYPKFIHTVTEPNFSPNNEKMIIVDDVRQQAYVSFIDSFLRLSNIVATRKFMVMRRGKYLRFNSGFTGKITARVYPMGNGGGGLPGSPTLVNQYWQEVSFDVENFFTFGRENGDYFEGIIERVELTTEDTNVWQVMDSDTSHFNALGCFYDNDFGIPTSPFETFELRTDGYWYSGDIKPSSPHKIGPSWTPASSSGKFYYVNNATDSSDSLRMFHDSYDDYTLEVIVKTDVNNPLTVTSSNKDPYIAYRPGTERFVVTGERVEFKRTASVQPVTGFLTIESIKIRIAPYE